MITRIDHIVDISVYAYQYQLATHLIGCIVLIALALATGIRPSIVRGHGTRLGLIIAAVFVFVQMPMTLIRMNQAYNPAFTLPDPLNTYLNFFWSPMCTVFLIWLYLSHVATSCVECVLTLPRERIDPRPYWKQMCWCVGAGIGSSCLIHEWLASVYGLDGLWLLRLLTGVGLAAVPMEILFFRARKNKIRFFNYTWAWFVGTWLYFIPKV